MGAESDQVKGKAKQAAGIITGDQNLEAEGKTDRRSGEAKEKVEDAKSKIEGMLDTAGEKAETIVDKAKAALHRNK